MEAHGGLYPSSTMMRDGICPVSYTHLDVYKRQLRRMALEEGKNLTESIKDALRKGLVEYL